jgi:hypothetical protein
VEPQRTGLVEQFLAVAEALRALPDPDILLDGEAMAHCRDGPPDFTACAPRMAGLQPACSPSAFCGSRASICRHSHLRSAGRGCGPPSLYATLCSQASCRGTLLRWPATLVFQNVGRPSRAEPGCHSGSLHFARCRAHCPRGSCGSRPAAVTVSGSCHASVLAKPSTASARVGVQLLQTFGTAGHKSHCRAGRLHMRRLC